MTIGEIIKKYRVETGMNMDDFAKRCGISKAYVSILERNFNPISKKPATPSLETIKSVAAAIQIDFNDLISMLDSDQPVASYDDNNSDIPPGFIPLPAMKKVPLVGHIACGVPILAEENIESYIDAPVNKHVDFALICEGDSMIDAGIDNGDAVYIRKQPIVENGQIAAVRIGDSATLKRVFYEKNQIFLQAANSKYPPIVLVREELENVVIEGLAVGFTHWF